MWNYWQVLCDKSLTEIEAMKQSGINPKNLKMDLAQHIVELFHGAETALEKRIEFEARFSKKQLLDVVEVEVALNEESISLSKLIKELNMASSVSDASRKIEQSGVKLDQEKVTDKQQKVSKGQEFILQVGKLHIKKVKLR